MAATRLIALHINKDKTVAQCLADRIDYSQNAEKTDEGEFISAYECDPKTADEEFLLSKRQYQHITGKGHKRDVIAYQIRQSFKPGEITLEEANRVGYETAIRFAKGKHAFIVVTHIDKEHIHNHIIFNSTTLDCTKKFRNFLRSGLAVQKVSDLVCLEHGLSVIAPKPFKERVKRTTYPKRRTCRDELCAAIDDVLRKKPKDFTEFVECLSKWDIAFKDGKVPAFRIKGQKNFICMDILGEGYEVKELNAFLQGKSLHRSKSDKYQNQKPREFNMLIDIQEKLAEGKTSGYERWAKKFNRKEAAKTVCLLKERGIDDHDDLVALTEKLFGRFDELSESIQASEKRISEIKALRMHIHNYSKTRNVYIKYRKAGYSKKFFEKHQEEIQIHKAAKEIFDSLGVKKIPKVVELNAEYTELISKKKADYAKYRKVRDDMREYLVAKQTVETILGINRKFEEEKRQKEKENSR